MFVPNPIIQRVYAPNIFGNLKKLGTSKYGHYLVPY